MATPELTPQIKPYLTIIEDRSPVQKMHTNIGHAKNAFAYSHSKGGTLWEWKDNEWKLLYTVEATRYGQPRNLPWNEPKPELFYFVVSGTTRRDLTLRATSEEDAKKQAKRLDSRFVAETVRKRP